MYRYETHTHTRPASQCADISPEELVKFYKELSYDGIFITNHFLDGNINLKYRILPYDEQIELYFADYEEAKKAGDKIGLKVFCGVEMSYKGTDFLVYGLDKSWYLAHSEIMEMKKSEELSFLIENGALVIQAHPFREARYIDHIRLFPRNVQGIEVLNAQRTEFENQMAGIYADNYGLLKFAGSDTHSVGEEYSLAGLEFDTPVEDERDFVEKVKNNEMKIFVLKK